LNGTLTGLGIALVVALVTALIGPVFIDWGDHRAAFEAQASRLLGVPVRVLGEVDARILPSPRIRFSQVVAGDEWAASKFTADSFSLDVALMPMLAGEFQVTKLHIDGGDLKATLAADGEISVPIAAGGMSLSDLDAITITDLEIQNSRITIADPAAGRSTVVENAGLHGQASSLAGPLKFDAHGTIDKKPYTLALSAGRFDKSGAGRVKLSVASADAPSFSFDGAVWLGKKPRFEGAATLVQTASAEGQPVREPWRVAGEVKSDVRTLEADKVEFDYGTPGRELRLTGGAAMVLGPKTSAEIRLKGRQIDLDRALGRAKDALPLPPAEVLTQLAARFSLDGAPPFPVRVTADVANVALGGDFVQDLRGAIVSTPGGWTLETLSARLPGSANAQASGALLVRDGEGPRFNGPLKLDAPNMPSLAHWLGGVAEKRPALALKTLKLDSTLAARAGAFALEDLKAKADGADVRGRLSFTQPESGRAKVEARLTANRLDLDALGVAGLEMASGDTDIDLALRADKLDYAKVTWSDVDIDLSAAEGAVDIRRLTIGDLGGARIVATGRLASTGNQPSGRLEAKIEARNLNGLVTVLRTSSLPPAFVDAIGARSAAIAPASLTAVVASSGGGTSGVTTKVSGTLGGTSVEFNASAPRFALAGPIKATLGASSADGARLLSQLGIPAVSVESFGPASFEASFDGDPEKGAQIDAIFLSMNDRAVFKGRAASADDQPLVGRVDMNIEDAGRYAVLLGRVPPASLPVVPLLVGGDVSSGKDGVQITRIAGTVQGRGLKGALGYQEKTGIRGELDLESLALGELAGVAIGPNALAEADAAGWPSGAPAPGLLDGLEGRVSVRTDKFDIASDLGGAAAKFNLVFGRNEFSVQDAETKIAGGAVKGNFAIRRAGADLSLAARMSVEEASLADLVWEGAGGPAARGKLNFTADVLGTGKSLSAVVANLTGSGSFTLRDAMLAGVDAGAFERTLIAVESGTEPPDAQDIANRFTSELAMGELEVSEMSSAFTIASGVARVSNAAVSAPLVNATASGTVDLTTRMLTAHMTLRPKVLSDIEDMSIPSADLTLSGSWDEPARSTETTAFANVLAVRAVEREIERVERMEAERKERDRKMAEEQERQRLEAEKRAAEEAEAARRKAIREATGEVPIGELPPPVDVLPQRTAPPAAASSPSPTPSARRQSPIDFLRRPVVPEASR